MRLPLIVFCCLALANADAAAGGFADFAARMDRSGEQALASNFVQRKTLQGFPKPIVTEGKLFLVRGSGMMLRTEKPISSSFIVRGGNITVSDADGSRSLNEGDEPGAAAVARLIAALAEGRTDALSKDFELQEQAGSSGRWSVRLTPVSAWAKALFRSLTLEGSEMLEKIVCSVKSGDDFEMLFSSTRYVPASALPPELR